ncbi:TPA: hypothetical protein N0F65_002184 [Lagenidium giganteum]|uniref:Uncharacterized protein n=1 Tax=Lagenidium giganteum TaxID=4803 RepID=A0AAV2YIX7_9STRA|nr:TPA: hypothetical protein N0F65_002184 [Lagenidium giganteum]
MRRQPRQGHEDERDARTLALLEQELALLRQVKAVTHEQIQSLLEDQKRIELQARKARAADAATRVNRIQQLQEDEARRVEEQKLLQLAEEARVKQQAEEQRQKQQNSLQMNDQQLDNLDQFLAQDSAYF